MRRLALLLAMLPGLAMAQPRPDVAGIRYDQRLGAQVPMDAALVDSQDRPTTLGAATAGRPAVLVLGYFACPALCGVIRDDAISALARSGLRTPDDYRLVYVSIDAAERPADAAKAKADDLARDPVPGAAVGWRFLTGTQPQIDRIERAVGYHARYDARLKQFLHPAGIAVLTPAGVVSSYVLGVGYRPGDVRAAVVRAGGGGVAERQAQPILLLCFHFDPSTGRYTLDVIRMLRLAAGLTVVMIVGLLALLARRRRRADADALTPALSRSRDRGK